MPANLDAAERQRPKTEEGMNRLNVGGKQLWSGDDPVSCAEVGLDPDPLLSPFDWPQTFPTQLPPASVAARMCDTGCTVTSRAQHLLRVFVGNCR